MKLRSSWFLQTRAESKKKGSSTEPEWEFLFARIGTTTTVNFGNLLEWARNLWFSEEWWYFVALVLLSIQIVMIVFCTSTDVHLSPEFLAPAVHFSYPLSNETFLEQLSSIHSRSLRGWRTQWHFWGNYKICQMCYLIPSIIPSHDRFLAPNAKRTRWRKQIVLNPLQPVSYGRKKEVWQRFKPTQILQLISWSKLPTRRLAFALQHDRNPVFMGHETIRWKTWLKLTIFYRMLSAVNGILES